MQDEKVCAQVYIRTYKVRNETPYVRSRIHFRITSTFIFPQQAHQLMSAKDSRTALAERLKIHTYHCSCMGA